MKITTRILTATLISGLSAMMLAPAPALSQQAGATALQERIAAVKTSFAESKARLHKYEWIETTITSLKGEEKSRKQNRCYYGAEGNLEKVPLEAAEEKHERGILGRIKERKKEELTDYMEAAAALVHAYLPPDPERIQQCKEAGNTSINILDPNKRAQLEFRDYLKPGDKLKVEIDLATNKVRGASVATSMEQDNDPVTLDVRFDTFPDGTIYTAETTLAAEAKHVKVVVENSGYRETGN